MAQSEITDKRAVSRSSNAIGLSKQTGQTTAFTWRAASKEPDILNGAAAGPSYLRDRSSTAACARPFRTNGLPRVVRFKVPAELAVVNTATLPATYPRRSTSALAVATDTSSRSAACAGEGRTLGEPARGTAAAPPSRLTWARARAKPAMIRS
jgi:hypothetical protein